MKQKTTMSIYEQRGVSSSKEEVHTAIKDLDPGIFPGAFCKVLPDLVGGDKNYCNIMHVDGDGTKTSLGYIYWKETGDISIFKGLAQDAIVMNIDDLLCAGVTTEPILYSSNIGRNKSHISGDVISALINGTQTFIDKLNSYGMNVTFSGGETSDQGDIVRTLDISGTAFVRPKKSQIIVAQNKIKPGDVIVGLSSTGRASYEDEENSGMGCNGLTSSRHDLFQNFYKHRYPESFDPMINKDLVYRGTHKITDESPVNGLDYGKLVLSSTRTYAPVLIELFKNVRKSDIHGIIHCSGGGQTKILKFISPKVLVVKDSLFPTPPLFEEIQKAIPTPWRDMYKNFNMGHRMEIYCPPAIAPAIITCAQKYNVDAKIIGHCIERKKEHKLTIISPFGVFRYS